MSIRHILLVAVVVGLAGCGGPKVYVRDGIMDNPPKRVAVLPFYITYDYDLTGEQAIPESHVKGREIFRKTVYYAFTPFAYEDMRLEEVDELLFAGWGPLEDEAWRRASPKLLGDALGVDALIYGNIGRIMHFATPFYTETSLSAMLRMVDAETGDDLWRQAVQVAERGGVVIQKGQVVDFVKDQIRSRNPGIKFLRISDIAARQAMKGMPDPPVNTDRKTLAQLAAANALTGGARLAVLPFDVKNKKWHAGAEKLRWYMGASLQESPFDVIELQQVEAVLVAMGWSPGEPLPKDLSIADFAKQVGADVVMRGTVTNWGRSFWIVQSSVKAAMELELVDAESGEVIWSGTHANRRHAGLSKIPTGYKSIATSALKGMKGSNLERVAKHLTRNVVQELNASPSILVYLNEKVR